MRSSMPAILRRCDLMQREFSLIAGPSQKEEREPKQWTRTNNS